MLNTNQLKKLKELYSLDVCRQIIRHRGAEFDNGEKEGTVEHQMFSVRLEEDGEHSFILESNSGSTYGCFWTSPQEIPLY